MARNNRAAGTQIHREVTRRVHNFVAASLMLVEHTRIFMREQYADTPFLDRYQAKVNGEFADNPLVRFVQDLRNFMLHKGLPDSEMFLDFQPNSALPGSGTLTTGIRIRSAHLSIWSGWSDQARAFIGGSGEFLEIRSFVEAYTDKIQLFHDWLQDELDRFHQADLDKLRTLQGSLNQWGAAAAPPQSPAGMMEAASKDNADEAEEEFSFTLDRGAVRRRAHGFVADSGRRRA
jgi:hypothetical protein